MASIRVVSDLSECRELWERFMPCESIGDLWEVRDCFQRHFRHRPHFVVSERSDGSCDLLPLSWIEENGSFGFFPGETWQGKTWLEQNKIVCNGNGGLADLLSACPSAFHLRYLSSIPGRAESGESIDEIGYLFLPPRYDYDMSNYLAEFSRKSAKGILKEIAALESLGVTYRQDEIADFDIMVRLNLDRFGPQSYFYDPRFLSGFRDLAGFLREKGWLRFTTVLINGEPAAIDMGCMFRGVYTLLAGGTNRRFPGIAKLINFHHMRRACQDRSDQVDFLCGDFNWKKLFHLTPRPLFLLTNRMTKSPQERPPAGDVSCCHDACWSWEPPRITST